MNGLASLGGVVAQRRRRGAEAPAAGGLKAFLGVSQIGVAATAASFGALAAISDGWTAPAALIGVAAAGVVSAQIMSRRLARPLADLAAITEAAGRRLGPESPIEPGQTARPDEIGRIARALDDLLVAFSRRLAASEEYVSDLAHEIRNPLASLRSAAEALQRAEGERQARLLEILQNDVQRLDRLVGELASASRLDADMVAETAEPFDFMAMLRRLVASFEHAIEAEGVELICDLPPGPVVVPGLEARLTQVVANVVENAISLCEEGDAIRIGTRLRRGQLLLVVEDTGPGIPDGAAEAIFRRFHSQRDPERRGRNSGLGLAIARQIVEAHGGLIWAEDIRPTANDLLSEPLGARFVVALPL